MPNVVPLDTNTRIREVEARQDEQEKELLKLKMEFDTVKETTNKSINIAEQINLQNSRFQIVLDNNTELLKETKKDMKELREETRKDMKDLHETISMIKTDTSKNNDFRLSGKQVFIFLIGSILLMMIGAGFAQSGK